MIHAHGGGNMANEDTSGKILDDVKRIVGSDPSYTDFDRDLVIHTNTALFALNQMGIGVPGFEIVTGNEKWSEFLESNDIHQINLHAVKTWVGLKVRMIFDPPTSSILAEAINQNLKEWEWRIYITENYVGEI